MSKITFGEFLANGIAACSSKKAVKIQSHYYDTVAIQETAKSIEQAVFTANLEDRKLNSLEALAFEILTDVAGYTDAKSAIAAYKDYLDGLKKKSKVTS